MIKIVCGKIKAGKTTYLQKLYEKDHQGDGFLKKRVYKDGKFYGYELCRLSNGNCVPLNVMDIHYKLEGYYDKFALGFHYSNQAYNDALLDIKHMIKNKVSPIYLDGIGDLELLRKGLDESFLTLLKSHIDIIISVQDKLVRKVINHYRLNNYQIVTVKNIDNDF